MGTQQSGVLDMSIADLVKDTEVLAADREEALYICNHDPKIEYPQLKKVKLQLKKIMMRRPNWGRIS